MSGYDPIPSAPPPSYNHNAPPPAYNPTVYGAADNYQQQHGAADNYRQQHAYAPQQTIYQGQQHAYAPQQTIYQGPIQPAPVFHTTHTNVITTQPSGPLPHYVRPKPSSYLWLSLFALLCCCFIFGIVAIVVGLDVDTAYNQGDHERARRKSKQALGWTIAAIGVGVVIHLSWIGAIVYLYAIARSVYSY